MHEWGLFLYMAWIDFPVLRRLWSINWPLVFFLCEICQQVCQNCNNFGWVRISYEITVNEYQQLILLICCRYKQRGLQFNTALDSRALRAVQYQAGRKVRRNDTVAQRRQIGSLDDSLDRGRPLPSSSTFSRGNEDTPSKSKLELGSKYIGLQFCRQEVYRMQLIFGLDFGKQLWWREITERANLLKGHIYVNLITLNGLSKCKNIITAAGTMYAVYPHGV